MVHSSDYTFQEITSKSIYIYQFFSEFFKIHNYTFEYIFKESKWGRKNAPKSACYRVTQLKCTCYFTYIKRFWKQNKSPRIVSKNWKNYQKYKKKKHEPRSGYKKKQLIWHNFQLSYWRNSLGKFVSLEISNVRPSCLKYHLPPPSVFHDGSVISEFCILSKVVQAFPG